METYSLFLDYFWEKFSYADYVQLELVLNVSQ
jgi:hypothetical protein